MSNEHKHVVGVEASLEVRDATVAPKLVFSFPGLEDPLPLWAELEALGWEIPDRPEPPDEEIDWSDPSGGTYRTLPYQVTDFEVNAPKWPHYEVAERGLKTVNMLRRLGVDLHIPIAYLDFLRRTQVSILRDPSQNKPVEKITKIPSILLLSKQPWSVLVEQRNLEVYETVGGPNQPKWYWSESQRTVDEIGSSREVRAEILSTVDMGWELMSRMEAPVSVDGRDRILRFLVRDVQDGSEMLSRIKRNVGDQCASLLMRPILQTGAVDNCLLIVSVVPAERFAEIGQSLISDFSDAVGRGRRYVPLEQEDAA